MAQQEVDKVLDAVAKRLKKIDGIKDVDSFRPASLSQLPRIVLHYLDSPWVLSPGRNEVHHTIQIDVILAPLSDVRRARREATRFIRDVKAQLFDKANGGLELIDPPNQTTVGSEGSQAIRNVVYDENLYLAAIVIMRAIEITGEDF